MKQEKNNRNPMPIIVGSPRSGTTLLRFMLDSHPELAIPPETGFLVAGKEILNLDGDLRENFYNIVTNFPPEAPNWADFQIPREEFYKELCKIDSFTVAEGFRAFYEMYAKRFSKIRWGEKTPLYCLNMSEIQKILPEARFIHLIRDGRDVAVSLRKQWFSPGHGIEIQAQYWKGNVLTAREQGKNCQYLEILYEDLIKNTEIVLRKICAFVELNFSKEVLSYYVRTPKRLMEHSARYGAGGEVIVSKKDRLQQQIETTAPPDESKINTWKNELSAEDQQQFEKVAGDLLQGLGYEV